ncbi:protein ACCELERATED CELL DEATH 6-like [Aristolochia californica]|uniref:protein ACCELERATED CELL DEATH 6-like n=1 Tax=Aristolochia californica TaxID=171875 RepID=UPI0035DE49B3
MDPLLVNATRSNNLHTLRELLANNPHLIRQQSPQRNTVLHIAADRGNNEQVQEILTRHQYLLDTENVKGDSAIHVAARAGHTMVVSSLINWCSSGAAAEVSDRGDRGLKILRRRNVERNNALHESVRNRRVPVVELLLAADPSLSCCVNGMGESPLYMSSDRGYTEIVYQILKTPLLPEARGQDFYGGPIRRTALHAAAIRGNVEIVRKLVEVMPALTRQLDLYGCAPLHYAVTSGNLKIVHRLLEVDSSVAYLSDRDGSTPAHVAARHGHPKIIQELLRHRPDCGEALDARKRNCLHVAVENGKRNVVKYILRTLELRNLINETDIDGNTPLHLAVINRHQWILYILVADRRVDKKLMNSSSMSALDVAESSTGDTAMVCGKCLISIALRESGALRSQLRPGVQQSPRQVLPLLLLFLKAIVVAYMVMICYGIFLVTSSRRIAFKVGLGYVIFIILTFVFLCISMVPAIKYLLVALLLAPSLVRMSLKWTVKCVIMVGWTVVSVWLEHALVSQRVQDTLLSVITGRSSTVSDMELVPT